MESPSITVYFRVLRNLSSIALLVSLFGYFCPFFIFFLISKTLDILLQALIILIRQLFCDVRARMTSGETTSLYHHDNKVFHFFFFSPSDLFLLFQNFLLFLILPFSLSFSCIFFALFLFFSLFLNFLTLIFFLLHFLIFFIFCSFLLYLTLSSFYPPLPLLLLMLPTHSVHTAWLGASVSAMRKGLFRQKEECTFSTLKYHVFYFVDSHGG